MCVFVHMAVCDYLSVTVLYAFAGVLVDVPGRVEHCLLVVSDNTSFHAWFSTNQAKTMS